MKWIDSLSNEKWVKYLILLIIIACCVLLLFQIGFFIHHAYSNITYPYDLHYTEGWMLGQTMNGFDYSAIYNPIDESHYTVAVYPPVYTSITSIFTPLFGQDFEAGRIVSLASILLTVVFLYLILRQFKCHRLISLFCSLLFLASPILFEWGVYFRPESLGLLFSIIAFWIAVRYINSRLIYLCIPFLILALFTKQYYIAAAGTIILFLIIQKRWRTALIFTGFYGVIVVGIFSFLNSITDGWFFTHVIEFNIFHAFDLRRAIMLYSYMLTYHLVVFGFAFAYVLYSGIRKKLGILCVYWIIAVIVPLSSGKVGAEPVYFIEIWAVSCILLGLIISNFSKSDLKNSLSPVFTIVLVSFLALNLIIQTANCAQQQRDFPNTWVGQEITEYIQNHEGPILGRPSYLVQTGREVIITYWELAHMPIDRWNHSGLIEDINNKKFTVIFSYINLEYEDETAFFTPQMLQAIRENYTLVDMIDGNNWIYEPNLLSPPE